MEIRYKEYLHFLSRVWVQSKHGQANYTSESGDAPFAPRCRFTSYKSSQRVISQGLIRRIFHCVLPTTKDIRMCWTSARIRKQSINILWHNLTETAHLEGQVVSEKIFENTSIIEILIFIYISDVMAILNNTDNVRVMQQWGAFVQPFLQWKTISITYSECVSVALGIQHEMRMRHFVFCALPCSTIFLHIIS